MARRQDAGQPDAGQAGVDAGQAAADDGPVPAAPVPAPGTRRHRLGLRAALGLGVFLPLVFALIAGIGLLGQEITAPTWIKTRVEAQAAQVLAGGSLRFGTITVQVSRDLHPQVRITDAVLRDASGALLARVPQIALQISPRGLLFRREVLPQRITLTGAELALSRDADGAVAVSFGEGMATGRAASLAGVLDQFDRLFESPALEALRRVEANGLILNYQDARAGRGWTVDGGALALDLTGGVTRLSGDLTLLSGRSYVTSLQLAYESPRASPAAEIALTVIDAAAEDIASQSPALGWLSVLDAPLSASLRLRLDERGELGQLHASLKLGQGALAPVPGAPPIGFDYARADLDYTPATQSIRFERVAVQSDWGAVRAEGQAWLEQIEGGWPGGLVGQFRLTELILDPPGLFPAPLAFSGASADLRLALAPFAVTVGQFTLDGLAEPGLPPLTGAARIGAAPEGWTVAVDVALPQIGRDRLMAIWPAGFIPATRGWFEQNLTAGTLTDMVGGVRLAPEADPRLALTQQFDGVTVRPLRRLPPITGAAGYMSYDSGLVNVALTAGEVAAPQGGAVDVAGSMLTIPDADRPDPPARIDLRADSTITAALALLDMPPFGYVSAAEVPVTVADGRARVEARFDLPLKEVLAPGEMDFLAAAHLTDLRSEALVPGRVLTAAALEVRADPQGLTIGGPLRVGRVPGDLVWRQDFATGDRSEVTGTMELSERFLEEFAIGLPQGSLRGEGQAEVALRLVRGAAPTFELQSALRGLALALPAVGWAKAADSAGSLLVQGSLGAVPEISRFALDAGGMEADGTIALTPDGGLARARFGRVRLGGWLDAPVDLVGQGSNAAPAVVIQGGTLDLRRAEFGDSGGQGGPMTLVLDRLQVTEGIALTDFRGEFDASDGFEGTFTAGVNGGAAVQGVVIPQNGQTAVRVLSSDAGAVLRSAGFLDNAQRGQMELTLLPAGREGSYDGRLTIDGLRVREAPALASLLNAISVIGLLQQLGGQGLAFDEVEADFRIDPDRITVLRSSAIGPGLGISLDGLYHLTDDAMDFQGVISPLYLINGIGAVLTRRGEGLIGFNFTLRGTLGAPQVGVNPFSVLTPGMFREIFRRPPPEITE